MNFFCKYSYEINGKTYTNGAIIEANDEIESKELIYSEAIEKGITKLDIHTLRPVAFLDSLGLEPVSEYEFTIKRLLTGLKCSYNGIHLTLKRIETKKNNISCDLEVTNELDIAKNPIIWRGNFNLTSEKNCQELAERFNNALPEKQFGIKWINFVQLFRKRVLEYLQQGEPVEEVKSEDLENFKPEYLIKPFIIKDTVNLIFGEGGSGKSSLAILFAILGKSTTLQLDLDIKAEPIKALYLDYENNRILFNSFLKQIIKGYGIKDFSIIYKACYMPFINEFEAIAEIVDEKEPDLVILDSLAPACGETVEVNHVTSFFQHLNKLKKTILLIGHTAKNSASETPYGSVYFLNLSRNAFMLKRKLISRDRFQVLLIHKKCNIGKLYSKPFAYEFDYSDKLKINKTEVKDEERDKTERIIEALKTKACSLKEISELTGVNYDTVKAICNRLNDKGYLVRLQNGKGVLYALKAEEPF